MPLSGKRLVAAYNAYKGRAAKRRKAASKRSSAAKRKSDPMKSFRKLTTKSVYRRTRHGNPSKVSSGQTYVRK